MTGNQTPVQGRRLGKNTILIVEIRKKGLMTKSIDFGSSKRIRTLILKKGLLNLIYSPINSSSTFFLPLNPDEQNPVSSFQYFLENDVRMGVKRQ